MRKVVTTFVLRLRDEEKPEAEPLFACWDRDSQITWGPLVGTKFPKCFARPQDAKTSFRKSFYLARDAKRKNNSVVEVVEVDLIFLDVTPIDLDDE